MQLFLNTNEVLDLSAVHSAEAALGKVTNDLVLSCCLRGHDILYTGLKSEDITKPVYI